MIADINIEALQETKKLTESISKDVSVTVVQLDVRDEKSVKNLVDVAISTYGRIDYCANVAGIIKFGDTTILPTEDFELVYEINLRGVFLCAKHQISAMLKQEPLASKYDSHQVTNCTILTEKLQTFTISCKRFDHQCRFTGGADGKPKSASLCGIEAWRYWSFQVGQYRPPYTVKTYLTLAGRAQIWRSRHKGKCLMSRVRITTAQSLAVRQMLIK